MPIAGVWMETQKQTQNPLGSSTFVFGVAKVRELAGIKLAFKNVSTLAGERRVHWLRSWGSFGQPPAFHTCVGVFMVGNEVRWIFSSEFAPDYETLLARLRAAFAASAIPRRTSRLHPARYAMPL